MQTPPQTQKFYCASPENIDNRRDMRSEILVYPNTIYYELFYDGFIVSSFSALPVILVL